MSYVTGCRLVVKLGTNEIYHRREQPPHPSTWRHVTKEPIVEGSPLLTSFARERREGMKGMVDRLHFWEAWNCDDYASSPGRELFALECIAPLGGRNLPRGTIYRVSWWTWEVATGRVPCENERERERDWPEDSASFLSFDFVFCLCWRERRGEMTWWEADGSCVFRDFRRPGRHNRGSCLGEDVSC